MKTKFGNASLSSHGYYIISSNEKGNARKMLHRLIYESNYGEIPDGYVVHHKDGNKTNNCIMNLELMEHGEHSAFHHIGRLKKTKNSTQYFNVYKSKSGNCKQRFIWSYRYYENNKMKHIKRVKP